MTEVDVDSLCVELHDVLQLDEYGHLLSGAWVVGSMVSPKFITEGSDVDVVLSFADLEDCEDYPFVERDAPEVSVTVAGGGQRGDGIHRVDMRFEGPDAEVRDPNVSLLD